MTSLCLIAAPDCRTGQSKGRYCAQLHSQSLLLVEVVLKPRFSAVRGGQEGTWISQKFGKKWQDVEDRNLKDQHFPQNPVKELRNLDGCFLFVSTFSCTHNKAISTT